MKVLYKDNTAHVILNDEDNYPLIQFFDVNFGVTLFPYMLILILVYCISWDNRLKNPVLDLPSEKAERGCFQGTKSQI